jgi:hypothetical protein
MAARDASIVAGGIGIFGAAFAVHATNKIAIAKFKTKLDKRETMERHLTYGQYDAKLGEWLQLFIHFI